MLGGLTAALLLVGQSNTVGGLTGLLQVGEVSPVRPLIEAELGDVPLAEGTGHDGQIYYAIGLDLDGDEVAPYLDLPSYRYRRILFSAMAGGFGLLSGQELLIGMVVTVVMSTAIAAGSVAASARILGRSDWLALAVILNPGVWLSVRLLTADVVAVTLMSLGILGLLTRRRLGIVAFALSGLTKDPYLLTPLGLAVSRDRRRWLVALVPGLVLAGWTLWVAATIDSELSGVGNITLPLRGIVEAASNWAAFDASDWIYLIFALTSVLAALLVAALTKSWLRWSLLFWGLLGASTSSWVWDFGNNAARAFAPIAVLVALSARVERVPAQLGDASYGQPAETLSGDHVVDAPQERHEQVEQTGQ